MIFVDSNGQATVQPIDPRVPPEEPMRPDPGPDHPSRPERGETGRGGEHLVRVPRTPGLDLA